MPPVSPNTNQPTPKALHECEAMLNYAMTNGKKIDPRILGMLKAVKKNQADGRDAIESIGDLHGMLASVIAPATPATVTLMEDTSKSGFAFMGPIPLIRKMMFVTIVCLMVFLGLFFFEEVDAKSINGDILSYTPLKFALNELFIVSAAALGAAFYALFEAYKFVSSSSYDTKYDSIYWIRFILGVVSGVLLAQFIFFNANTATEAANAAGLGTGTNPAADVTSLMTYKPLLAFLGGFSARVVHKILNSLVDSVETFISGSARDAIRAREDIAKAQLQDNINAIHQDNNRKEAANRMESAIKLIQLQDKIAKGASNADLQTELKMLVNQIMSPVSGTTLYTDVPNQPAPNNQGANTQQQWADNPANNPNLNNNLNPPSDEIIVPAADSFDIPENFVGDMNTPPNNDFKP
jgi:hypothetical protein